MNKRATLNLIQIIITSSLVLTIVSPTLAQSIPDFTIKLEAHPYDKPKTYGIDPYTGENVTIQEGYHVENVSVIFTIRNQPTDYLYYNVRYKGHYEDSWTEVFSYYLYNPVSGDSSPGNLVLQTSNYGYTTITIPATFPYGKIDFQIQALKWHYIQVFIYDHPLAPPPLDEVGHYEERFTLDQTSTWSNTQTLTFAPSPTFSPTPTSTPLQSPTPFPPEAEYLRYITIIALALIVILIGLGILAYYRKYKMKIV